MPVLGSKRLDIVFLCSGRVGGSVLATVTTEVLAAAEAGFKTGIQQSGGVGSSRALLFSSPQLDSAVRRGAVTYIGPETCVECSLLIIHDSSVYPARSACPPKATSDQCVIVIHDVDATDGAPVFRKQIEAEAGVSGCQVAPVDPSVRRRLAEIRKSLTLQDWHPLIDLREWPERIERSLSDPIIVGRHFYADSVSWPETRSEILAAYPTGSQFEIRVLGGSADAMRKLKIIPENWRLLLPRRTPPQAFLSDLDAYVAFSAPERTESYDRNVLEALACGLPVVLPSAVAPVYGSAALYAQPDEVTDLLLALRPSKSATRRQCVLARAAVEDFFSACLFAARLQTFFGLSPEPSGARRIAPVTVDVEAVDVAEEIAAQFYVKASPHVATSWAATPVVDQSLHEDNDIPLPADFSLPSSEEAGFLNDSDGAVFEADLYIAAMARSGSTLLANLLTLPPTHWVMQEPWFVRGATGRKLHQQAILFGWPVTWREWVLPRGAFNKDSMKRRYEEFLVPFLAGLRKWGAKEVRPQFHEPTIATLRPKKIILLTRDVSQAYPSFLELHQKQHPGKYSERWTRDYCTLAAAELVKLADRAELRDRLRIVRYEDLSSIELQSSLAEWLDWPLRGDPARTLTLLSREYEADRHRAGSRGRRLSGEARGLPPFIASWAAELAEQCHTYQERFGY